MIQTTARVPTANAAKYVINLCKHWGERIDVNFRKRQGVIHLGSAVASLTPAQGELVVTILGNDDATIERFQSVVAERIAHLAQREGPLEFDWHRLSDVEVHAL